MDVLEQIKKKLLQVSELRSDLGVESVITHIEIAEKHFLRGNVENDDYYYTDAIYRSNHAFEGILKEAYYVLANKSPDKKNIFEIEQYLLNENILNSRVVDLLKNYRQEWRNPSTHDYRLFFTEDEAILAIVTVSAFINILLNQIIEKLSFEKEKLHIEKNIDELRKEIPNYEEMTFLDRVNSILTLFTNTLKKNEDVIEKREVELIGMLTAFISSFDERIQLIREPILTGSQEGIRLRPDLILKSGEESLIIEVRKVTPKKHILAVEEQLLRYLQNSGGIKQGIVYYSPTDSKQLVTTMSAKRMFDGEEYTIGINIPSTVNYKSDP